MLTHMRTFHRLAACAALLILPSSGAIAQASPGTRLSGRVPATVHADLVAAIDSAAARGLPAEPLVQKALEGATKRAQPQRIISAVRTLASELQTARLALGPDASDADLIAAASALHAGVAPEVLRRLRKDRPRQPLTIALGVMAELIGRGVTATQATQTVLALVEGGARDETLVAFGREVERDISTGAPPSAATEIRGEAFGADRANAPSSGGLTNAGVPPTQAAPPRKP